MYGRFYGGFGRPRFGRGFRYRPGFGAPFLTGMLFGAAFRPRYYPFF